MRGIAFICFVAAALVSTSFLSVMPASALTQQQIAQCVNEGVSPDQRISGCTAVIQSGKYRGKNLAVAFSNRCVAYNDKGENDRALADCNEAIRLDPKYAHAYNNRGVAYADKDDYDRAIADFTEAIQLEPDYANAYYNRGLAWERKNDLQKALADYKKFAELNPSDSDGPTAIARVTKALGQ